MAAKKPNTFDQLYPGRFLKAGLFEGKQVTLAIRDYDREELQGEKGPEVKVVLKFTNPRTGEDLEQQLVCCKTNGLCLKAMFGDQLQNWIGKRVTLFPSTWNGEPAIRVWGSPDIAADMQINVVLPRKKPIPMLMHKVEVAA